MSPLKFHKRVLAELDTVYAITSSLIDGKRFVFAGSEARQGKALYFCEPDWQPVVFSESPGGYMSIIPFDNSEVPSVLMIEDCYPIFKSEGAGVSIYKAENGIDQPWVRTRVFDLPFVHRIERMGSGDHQYIMAASVCGKKEFQEDWQHPGAVYSVKMDAKMLTFELSENPYLKDISRNHGMFINRSGEKETLYISGDQGVFAITHELDAEGEFACEKIYDQPTSDIILIDMDEDGVEEMLTIEPFHGELAKLSKKINGQWVSVWDCKLQFGHVAWAGMLKGRMSILTGSRAGEKELSLHTLVDKSSWHFETVVIDKGVGPSQIEVVHCQGRDLIFSANNSTSEVVLYEIE